MRDGVDRIFEVNQINSEKEIREWTLLSRIVKYKERYILAKCAEKGEVTSQMQISEADALKLVEALYLRFIPSERHEESGTFMTV